MADEGPFGDFFDRRGAEAWEEDDPDGDEVGSDDSADDGFTSDHAKKNGVKAILVKLKGTIKAIDIASCNVMEDSYTSEGELTSEDKMEALAEALVAFPARMDWGRMQHFNEFLSGDVGEGGGHGVEAELREQKRLRELITAHLLFFAYRTGSSAVPEYTAPIAWLESGRIVRALRVSQQRVDNMRVARAAEQLSRATRADAAAASRAAAVAATPREEGEATEALAAAVAMSLALSGVLPSSESASAPPPHPSEPQTASSTSGKPLASANHFSQKGKYVAEVPAGNVSGVSAAAGGAMGETGALDETATSVASKSKSNSRKAKRAAARAAQAEMDAMPAYELAAAIQHQAAQALAAAQRVAAEALAGGRSGGAASGSLPEALALGAAASEVRLNTAVASSGAVPQQAVTSGAAADDAGAGVGLVGE
jgi:hypothetical protein